MNLHIGGREKREGWKILNIQPGAHADYLGDIRQAGFSKAVRVESFGLFQDTSDFKPYGFPISLNVVATR
jgi:hypothetical protein